MELVRHVHRRLRRPRSGRARGTAGDPGPASRTGAGPTSDGFLSRRVATGVYLPALVFEIGIGAATPVVPVSATGLGANLAVAGVMAAGLPVGQILGDVPAGALAARVGDRSAMLIAAVLGAAAYVGCALARDLVVLGVCVVALGAVNAVFFLARQSYLTEITPVVARARAMSTLGGAHRIGFFIGPFAGAAVIHGGGTSASYWLAATTAVVCAAVVAGVPDLVGDRVARQGAARSSLLSVLRANAATFATLGFAVLLVGAIRGARQVVLPLWSEHLGLSPATTSVVFGVAGAVDMLLFYPAGKVMDRLGRLWVAIPSMLVLAGGVVLLPLTHTVAAVTVVAMVIGLGNGLGSGLLMTLGADAAPPPVRAQFLGIWRLFQDSGHAAGPLLVAAGAALGSLAAGIVAMGAVGVLAAVGLARWVPRFTEHADLVGDRRRAAREEHG